MRKVVAFPRGGQPHPSTPNSQPLNDFGGQKDEKAEWVWMHS